MIWIVGNKGMLGADIANTLSSSGYECCETDIEVDITNYDSLISYTKTKNINWIVNCSAYTAVDKAEDEKGLAYKINAEGVKNLADIAKEIDAKLVHFSTDYVFSGEKNGPYFEDDETGPKSIYGQSKLAGEINIIKNLKEHFIIRISWLFGIYGKNFVYTMLKLFNEKEEIRVVADQFGSPTYTTDAARLIEKIIKLDSNDYGIYHFSNTGETNWYEFSKEIYSRAKQNNYITKPVKIIPIHTSEFKTKAVRPKNSCMSKEKVTNTFNISIPAWQEALDDFLKKIISGEK